ncbi:hypothetical protein JXM67_03895 [candidate division WOR-3 bacterium]|nr:hypothetical protein [candidate division WOR-3 bacterium]
MKKALLIVGVLTMLVSAGTLMAKTDWHGKFWGDSEGEWKGTLFGKEQDPPYFKGEWVNSDGEYGKLYAVLEYAGHGIYKIEKGIIYDHKGNEIGVWDGYFDENIKPGYAEGTWSLPHSKQIGKWQGQRILP